MAEICSASYGNIGTKCDKGDIRGVPVGLILATKTQVFATKTSFATEADILTGIKAKNLFPLMGMLEFDDNTEEATIYTSPLGLEKFIRNGKYKFTMRFDLSLKQNQALQTFLGAKIRAYIVDSEGQIWGYSDDGTTVQGFSVTLIPQNQKSPTADAPGWSVMNITLTNPNEWNKYGLVLQPSFVAEDLTSLSDVDLSIVGTATATSVVVSVGVPTGVIDGTGAETKIPISGITTADFTFVKASDGTAQTPTSMTDNSDGTYSFVFTAAVTGSVNLKAPSAQANAFLIESTGAASFTIS